MCMYGFLSRIFLLLIHTQIDLQNPCASKRYVTSCIKEAGVVFFDTTFQKYVGNRFFVFVDNIDSLNDCLDHRYQFFRCRRLP